MTGDEIREATKAAVEEAKEEVGGFEEPTPAREHPAGAAPDGDAGDDDGKPSAEDLAKIDRDPRAKELYRKMLRGYRERTGATAAERKDAEMALQAVEVIRADPRAAALAFAQAAGLEVRQPGEAEKPGIAQRVYAKLARSIGPEAAAVLGPAILDVVNDAAGDAILPVTQHLAETQQAATNAAMRQGISQFAARVAEEGGEWDESVEAEMAQLITSGKVIPKDGMTMPELVEFLEILHNNVMAKRARSERRASLAARTREGTRGGGAIRAGMKPLDAVRAAVAAAKRELGY